MSKRKHLIKIQSIPDCYINDKCEFFNASGTKLNVRYDKGQYARVTIYNKTYQLHRLIAEAYHGLPEDDSLEVNHKDGNKLNNHPDNLEWVTRSGNLIHAFKTGLRTDNTFVEVLDLRTNEVLEFYSISECARYFKMNVSNTLYYLYPEGNSRILNNFYLVRKKGDPWPKYNPDDIGKYRNGYPKPVMVRDIANNKVTIYNSMTVTAKELGFTYAAIAQFIFRNGKDKPYKGYLIKYIDNAFEFEELIKEFEYVEGVGSVRVNYGRNKLPIPIEITDLEGNKQIWDSSEKFCKHMNIKKATFQKSVWLKGSWNNYKVKYLD